MIHYKRIPGYVFAVLLFLTALGCTSVPPRSGGEDVYVDQNGRLPLVLRFPPDMKPVPPQYTPAAVTEKSLSAELWMGARFYHVEQKMPETMPRAFPYYERIISIKDATSFMARNDRACLLIDTKKYREAETAFQELITERCPIIPPYYNLYILYKAAERYPDSVKVLFIIKERFPANIFPYIELGDMYAERSKTEDALGEYIEAMKVDPNDPVPLYKAAVMLDRDEQFAEAEKYYRECMRRFPQFSTAYTSCADMLLRLNRKNDADAVIKEGIKHNGSKELKRSVR